MTQDPKHTPEESAWADQVLTDLTSFKTDKQLAQATLGRFASDGTAGPGPIQAEENADDQAWADQVMRELPDYAKDTTAWEKTHALGSGAGVGLVESARNVLVDLPRSITGAMGIPPQEGTLADYMSRGLDAATKALTPEDLRIQDSAWMTAGQIGGSSVLPIAATVFGGPLGGGLAGTFQQGGASGADAMRSGASPAGIGGAALGGAIVGGAGGAALDGVLMKINTRAGNKLVESLLRAGGDLSTSSATRSALVRAGEAGVRAGESAVAGAGVGLAYNTLVNAIHNFATDEDIPLLMNADVAIGGGAAIGGLIRGATEAAVARRMHTGRKYTANGWEGPELDMSGMLESDQSPYEPPLTKTPDEHFAPMVEGASRDVGREIHTGTIPRDVSVEDLATIMQAEHGLPRGKALEAAALALDETGRLDESKRNADVLEAHTAWQARQAEVAAEGEKYRAIYEQRAAEAKAKEDAAITKAHQEWQARRQANAADADRWKAVYDQRVAQAQEAESKRIQEAHTALQERQAEAASEADVWKARFEEAQRAREETETARVRDEHVKLQERQQELSAEETLWRDEYRRRNPDPERPPNAEPDSALGKTLAREGLQSEAQRAYEERLAKAKAEADRIEALWASAADEGSAGQQAEMGLGPRYQKAGAPVIRAQNPVVDRQGRTIVDIGGRMRGTDADTTGRPPTEVAYKADVGFAGIEAARQLNPNVATRLGFLPGEAEGLYSSATNTMRVGDPGNLDVITHEIGHAVENRVLGSDQSPLNDVSDPGVARKRHEELIRLGKLANPGVENPANTFTSEGWAEFMRMWLAQHEDLMVLAPEMTKWFDGKFLRQEPGFAKAMDNARTMMDAWRFQGSEKRGIGTIERPKTTQQKLRKFLQNFGARRINRTVFSMWEAAARYEQAKAAAGFPTPKHQRIDNLIRQYSGNADQLVERFVTKYTSNLDGVKTGNGLTDATKPYIKAGGTKADLELYMKSRRTKFLAEDKVRVVDGVEEQRPIKTGMSLEDANSNIAKLEAKYPNIEKTADDIRAWWDRVLDYVCDADPTFKVVRNAMRQEGEIYFVLKKVMDDSAPRSRGGSKSDARNAKLGHKLSEGGSEIDTKNILETMQDEARRLVAISHERLVLRSLVENGKAANLGGLFEDISKTLKGTGTGYKIGEEVPAADFAVADVQSFFEPVTFDKSGRAVFHWAELETNAETGKTRVVKKAYAVHPDVYEAAVGMNPQDFRQGVGWVAHLARFMAKAQVVGFIVLNPKWALYKNLAWDAETALLNTRYNHGFRDMMLSYLPTMMQVAAYEVTGGRFDALNSKWVEAYHAQGLAHSAPLQSELRIKNRTTDLFASPTKRVVRNMMSTDAWFQLGARLTAPSDVTLPVWEFKRAAKQVGWEPGQPMSPQQSSEIALATKTITGNRSEGGTFTTAANRFVPFIRAWAVGPRDTYRAATARGNRLRFAIKAGSVAALAAYWYEQYKDDESVQAKTAGETMSYATIPLENGDAINIPIAPEMALIWGTTQFVLNGLDDNDKYRRQGSDLAKAYWDLYKPPVVPAVLQEPYAQLANKQYIGSDVPIESAADLAKPVQERFDKQTPQIAIGLSKVFPWISPRRFEHAIEALGFPGTVVSGDATMMFDLSLDPAAKNEAETLGGMLTGTWLRDTGKFNQKNRWLHQLNSMRVAADQAHNSVNVPFDPKQELIRKGLHAAGDACSTLLTVARTYEMTRKQREEIMAEVNNISTKAVWNALAGNVDLGSALSAQSKAAMLKRQFEMSTPRPIPKPSF